LIIRIPKQGYSFFKCQHTKLSLSEHTGDMRA